MSIELMGRRRHAELIKAAEVTVDLINDGIHPNEALKKSAQKHDLNSKEIALVSNTVNNALTVSHLADSEPEHKADPFVITNADEVSQQLFPDLDADEKQTHNDPEPGKKPEGADVESPLSLDLQDQQKKAAAVRFISPLNGRGPHLLEDTYLDYGSYMDADDDGAAFVKTAREAFGYDDRAMTGGRMKVVADLNNGVRLDNDWGTGDRTAEHAKRAAAGEISVNTGRMVGNPYTALCNLKVACDEARTRYSAARDRAYQKLASLIETFRRTDAPDFARVSALAKHAGVDPSTLSVVFTAGQLDRFGHTDQQVKLASVRTQTCTNAEYDALQKVSELETFWKEAGYALAVQEEAERRTAEAEAVIHKIAAVDAGAYAREVGSTARDFPLLAMGVGQDSDVLGDVLGIASDEKPDYSNKSPLSGPAQQRIRNTEGATTFSSLFDDDYIASRPIPDVVRAYNAAVKSSSKAQTPEMIRRLVKEQLATNEDLDVQTMINLNKGP